MGGSLPAAERAREAEGRWTFACAWCAGGCMVLLEEQRAEGCSVRLCSGWP
jgi:hypothetical protein